MVKTERSTSQPSQQSVTQNSVYS